MRADDPDLRAAQQERRAASDNYAEVSRRCRAEEQAALNRLNEATKMLGIAVRAADERRNRP